MTGSIRDILVFFWINRSRLRGTKHRSFINPSAAKKADRVKEGTEVLLFRRLPCSLLFSETTQSRLYIIDKQTYVYETQDLDILTNPNKQVLNKYRST